MAGDRPATHGGYAVRPGSARRRHLLLVEANDLTRWSITTYLRKWFIVQTADSRESAARLAGRQRFAALVLSDQLSAGDAAEIRRIAAQRSADVRAVQTVAGATEPPAENAPVQFLEKPFDLASLARLLGVPDSELTTQ